MTHPPSHASHTPGRAPLSKRILAKPFVQASLTLLASLIVRAVYLTSKRQLQLPPSITPFATGESACIVCFWHGRILFTPFLKPNRRVDALVSRHGDGALIAAMLGWFGVRAVRGSSSKGGAKAARALLQSVAQGATIAITPDGPRGPRYVCAEGAVWLAAHTGLPIVPFSGASSRARTLKSWDAFTIPLPFGRIICHADEPIHVPPHADAAMIESYRQQLESSLIALTTQCDREARGA